jgi:hypothetical protein
MENGDTPGITRNGFEASTKSALLERTLFARTERPRALQSETLPGTFQRKKFHTKASELARQPTTLRRTSRPMPF